MGDERFGMETKKLMLEGSVSNPMQVTSEFNARMKHRESNASRKLMNPMLGGSIVSDSMQDMYNLVWSKLNRSKRP
jgi:hypothetical protein